MSKRRLIVDRKAMPRWEALWWGGFIDVYEHGQTSDPDDNLYLIEHEPFAYEWHRQGALAAERLINRSLLEVSKQN